MGGNGFLFLGTVYVDKLWGNFILVSINWPKKCVGINAFFSVWYTFGYCLLVEHFICYRVFLFWTCLVGILWLYMHYLPCIIPGQYYICWVGTIEAQNRYKNWYLLVFIFVIVLVVIVSKGEKNILFLSGMSINCLAFTLITRQLGGVSCP